LAPLADSSKTLTSQMKIRFPFCINLLGTHRPLWKSIRRAERKTPRNLDNLDNLYFSSELKTIIFELHSSFIVLTGA
jgi:hypothetical protein